jgi:2-keto-3-deoxy-L-rhamnonate aldolase RhmA
MATANREIVVIPQVEHIDGARNIESIVKVEGISAIFLGPYDLSGSMGRLGEVSDPEVTDAINKIKITCEKAGIPTGIFGIDAEAAKPYISQGHTLMAVGADTLMMGKAARKMLDILRVGKMED